ncbi:hypothetical protein ACQP3J_31755, partial [Escherichia coli]
TTWHLQAQKPPGSHLSLTLAENNVEKQLLLGTARANTQALTEASTSRYKVVILSYESEVNSQNILISHCDSCLREIQ